MPLFLYLYFSERFISGMLSGKYSQCKPDFPPTRKVVALGEVRAEDFPLVLTNAIAIRGVLNRR